MPELLFAFQYVIVGEAVFFEGAWSYAAILGTRIAIYQPQYFPRLHYFARIFDSDVFAIADYLQYVRRHTYPSHEGKTVQGPSYQAHTPIKIGTGPYLLSVPVCHKDSHGIELLCHAEPDMSKPWMREHLQTIEMNYKKAPQFETLFPGLERMFSTTYASLAELSTTSIQWGLGVVLGISDGTTIPSLEEIHRALKSDTRLKTLTLLSNTPVKPAVKQSGRDANDWLVDVCAHFGATEYHYGGTSAGAYMDFNKFQQAGIALKEQQWVCREYPQRFPKAGFSKNLSIIDLLMNVEPHEARQILHANNA